MNNEKMNKESRDERVKKDGEQNRLDRNFGLASNRKFWLVVEADPRISGKSFEIIVKLLILFEDKTAKHPTPRGLSEYLQKQKILENGISEDDSPES